MFNDGNNQIPGQNEPGLDASGIMWYKDGIWCDSETDTDGDELPDCGELRYGSGAKVYVFTTQDGDNKRPATYGEVQGNNDFDGDGLKNGDEVSVLVEKPYNRPYLWVKSFPDSEDSDGDGILDIDDKWSDRIWSESNPSDLRYKALNPMKKNTLETLYPDICNHMDELNPNYITIKDNTVSIRTYAVIVGSDCDRILKGSNSTVREAIKQGIEEYWTIEELQGSKYDFVKGMKIKLKTNVEIIDQYSGMLRTQNVIYICSFRNWYT